MSSDTSRRLETARSQGATPSSPRLLICGKMGSGKSTAADYLVEHHDALRWSRSTAMKCLAHALVDGSEPIEPLLEPLLDNPAVRASAAAALERYADTYDAEPGKPRRLYQDVAQIVMDRDPLAFERALTRNIDDAAATEPERLMLVDDVRSLASFEWFRAYGFHALRIAASPERREARMRERDGYLPDAATFAHRSEVELDRMSVDFEITNDSDDTTNLFREIDAVVAAVRG